MVGVDCIVHEKWKIVELIAQGGFGSIFKAHNIEKKSEVVAIKTEKRANKDYLAVESEIYTKLAGIPGFPKMIWFGKTKFTQPGKPNEKLPCCILVLEHLSSSLSDLFSGNNKKFSLKSVLMLSQQMIDRLATLHSVGIVHRDVKPGNFVMGKGDQSNVVYLIDFGLAHSYLDETGTNHITYASNVCFRGTHRYASVTAHARIEQSRRDDMEALGYVLIYFLNGLPWQNLQVERKDRRKVIGDIKAKMPLDKLTEGLPVEFQKYMQYTRCLRFSEEPNYVYLKSLFSSCLKRHNLVNDGNFDWVQPEDTNPKDGNYVEEAALTTPSDNDNSFNREYKKQKERNKQKRNVKADEFDEDLEYEPVHKKKKVGNQKFIAQVAQNDWNSDEYVDAKNDGFIETDYLTAKSKKISNSAVSKRDGLLTTKRTAAKGKLATTKKSTAAPRSPAKKNRTLVLSEDESY